MDQNSVPVSDQQLQQLVIQFLEFCTNLHMNFPNWKLSSIVDHFIENKKLTCSEKEREDLRRLAYQHLFNHWH